jgi:hypothetical protein
MRIVSVESVLWPDTSLGCPQPGQFYAQVTVEGYRLVVEHAGCKYHIHLGQERAVICRTVCRSWFKQLLKRLKIVL